MRLRLRLVVPGRRRPLDVDISVGDPTATVDDLVRTIAPEDRRTSIRAGGRSLPTSTPLRAAGLLDGTEVHLDHAPGVTDHLDVVPTPSSRSPGSQARVVTGFDCGRQRCLPPGSGELHVARAGPPSSEPDDDPTLLAISDPTVSRRWRMVSIPPSVAAGAESLRIQLGAATVEIGAPPTGPISPLAPWDRPPQGGSTRPILRAPRPEPPPAAPAIRLPPPVDPPPGSTPLGLAALVASGAGAVAMVALTGSRTYAVLALLGPLAMGASWSDGARLRRRHRRRTARERLDHLAHLEVELIDGARHARLEADERLPGPARLVARALDDPTRCWDRRIGDHDALVVTIAHGTVPWAPTLQGSTGEIEPDLAAVLARHSARPDEPVPLALERGRPIALVGPRRATRSLARSIAIQATVLHGPSDLGIAILCDRRRDPTVEGAWTWASWLPHAESGDGRRLLAAGAPGSHEVIDLVAADGAGEQRPTMAIVDLPDPLHASRGPWLRLLRCAEAIPIVLVDVDGHVPAECVEVIGVDEDGTVTVPSDRAIGPALVTGVGPEVADAAARALASLHDPDLGTAEGALPEDLHLLDLDPLASDATALAGRWRAAGTDSRPIATLGRRTEGAATVDLAAAGPHALVAGTTGAGKSELLRTLVASLAVACRPDHLTFVLVDFKGGAAFDACERLPHVVGVVTDLDAQLADRVRRGLHAELRRREEVFRQAGVDDLAAFRAGGGVLPRLVIVVDEFATLRTEVPEFADDLVAVAERGRSLGLHLVLATQRPAGAVSDRIRANVDLRLCLRVADAADSTDVIGTPNAASLPRNRPGRALARFGPGELTTLQVARTSGGGGSTPAVEVRPLHRWLDGTHPETTLGRPRGSSGHHDDPTDLERIVDAASEAWVAIDGGRPHRPWSDPLPERVPLSSLLDRGDLTDEGDQVPIALADDPDRQRHVVHSWRPADGPLVIVGLTGSGTSTAAAAAAAGHLARTSPGTLHVHAIDAGGGLEPLADLDAVGDVIDAADLERQRRLLAELRRELDRRRGGGPAIDVAADRPDRPDRLLVIDGVGSFRQAWTEGPVSAPWEDLVELVRHGAAAGLHVVLTATSPPELPHQVLAACRQRLVLQLGDATAAATLGVDGARPELPPGRGTGVPGRLLVHVAQVDASLRDRLRRRDAEATAPSRLARPVAVLPHEVDLDDLLHRVDTEGRPPKETGASLRLLVGIDEERLEPVELLVERGAHVLVAGPPRSGRSTTLATLARSAAAAGAPVRWAHEMEGVGSMEVAGQLRGAGGGAPLVVMIDDADRTPPDDDLAELLREDRTDVVVVAAVRSDRARAGFGHWTRELRVHRCGLLLQPDLDLDGDLLGARLPRRLPVTTRPGLGWLVDRAGERLVQVASAPPPSHLEPNP